MGDDRLRVLLEKTVIPLYYDDPARWCSMVMAGMRDILPYFDSNRLAAEYYDRLYLPAVNSWISKDHGPQ